MPQVEGFTRKCLIYDEAGDTWRAFAADGADGRAKICLYIWDPVEWQWEAAQKGSGEGQAVTVENWPNSIDGETVAVTGTFWQATQPVSGTFWQATQPVSGTFWQATQPVSDAGGSLTVDGDFAASSYSNRVHIAGGGIIYIGDALPGTAESAASWRIQKIDTANPVKFYWADGNSSFDNVWDSRESLSYS